jgi:hypothetical protein
MHWDCVGLPRIPPGDWFCGGLHCSAGGDGSLAVSLPTRVLAAAASQRAPRRERRRSQGARDRDVSASRGSSSSPETAAAANDRSRPPRDVAVHRNRDRIGDRNAAASTAPQAAVVPRLARRRRMQRNVFQESDALALESGALVPVSDGVLVAAADASGAVGVSEDAFIIAKKLLPMILDKIKDFRGLITDDDNFIFDFDYTIRVGNKTIPVKKIEVELTFEKTNNSSKLKRKNILPLGLTYHNPDLKSISNKGTITYKSEDIIRLGINFRINTLAKYQQLFRELTNYKEYIPSLAHEIKHFIDSNVEGATSNLGNAIKYGITTVLVGMPASDFIYQMYYIHKIENSCHLSAIFHPNQILHKPK